MATTSKKRTELSNAVVAENRQKPEAPVGLKEKFGKFWEFMEREKKIQELEAEIKKLKKFQEQEGMKYPELLQAKGCADRMYRTTLMDICDKDGYRIWIHAEDKEEAHQILEGRSEKKKKSKESKKAKKAKLQESS